MIESTIQTANECASCAAKDEHIKALRANVQYWKRKSDQWKNLFVSTTRLLADGVTEGLDEIKRKMDRADAKPPVERPEQFGAIQPNN